MDDDVLLHPNRFRRLRSLLNAAMNLSSPFYIGKVVPENQPVRRKNDKWYLSYEEWPHDTFPIWYQGLAFILSPTLADKLYKQALQTSYIFTDDVYIGILVDRLRNSEDVDLRTEVTLRTFNITCLVPPGSVLTDLERSTCGLVHIPNFTQFWGWAHNSKEV